MENGNSKVGQHGTNVGKNPRGRMITYRVYKTKEIFFDYEAKKFTEARVRIECKKRNIKPPVIVHYETVQKWGINFNSKEVTWEE